MAKSKYGYTGIYNATAITLADEEGAGVALDAKGNVRVNQVPAGADQLSNSSGNVANAIATATLTSAVGKTTYITGFSLTGSGATAGAAVTVTVTGILGGTISYTYCAATGATVANTSIFESFAVPIPATGTNTNIVVSCPALGAGNTNNTISVRGFNI